MKLTTCLPTCSANGVAGQLIYCHGANTYMFRVYHSDGKFTDYDILHCDLSITINDADAFFYQSVGEDGTLRDFLDHSRSTLGI